MSHLDSSSASSQRIAFVGLGVMGFPMAGHLLRAGHSVTVYNRTQAKAKAWVDQHKGQAAATPREAAQLADVVCVCVGNDDDVRSVVYGELGVLSGMSSGGLLIDHTTASAELARELAVSAAAQGVGFIDAPVSGGQAGAERGALTAMCGGSVEDYHRAEPVLTAYTKFSRHLGAAGSGQLAKMVNQICIAGVVQGLAEGLWFAQQAGLPVADVVEVISKGAAQSWQMDNRAATMLSDHYEHGFAVDWMRKDLALVISQAHKMSLQLPLTDMVNSFYADVQAMGGGRWDTSSLLRRLQRAKRSDEPGALS
jgi:3-hydroxyisobutyrate dehydrogenase-like beta-hydroxyacid dehydrogenase